MSSIKSAFVILLFLCGVFVHADIRKDWVLDTNWYFTRGEVKGAELTAYDDSGWEKISIPHNWGYVQAQKGDTKYYRGPGWYRRSLEVKPLEGKRYFVKFEAASLVADVYVNGRHLGQHRGGFSAFCYEITDLLADSGVNMLAVRVSNKAFQDVAPLGGDFNVYGGIYRPVHLIETSDVCFLPTNHASPGVAWLQTSVSKKEAILDVTALVSNGTDQGLAFNHFPPALNEVIPQGAYTLRAMLVNELGESVAGTVQQINVTPHIDAPYSFQVKIKKPHLWQGTDDPYLYRAVVELLQDGLIIDKVEQEIGLRTFWVDADKGFFLNGKPYPIRGVSKHQDRKDLGWAVSHANLDEDMSLIQEMGANAIRLAHYQHSNYFLSLCDRAGMLVYTEIPQVAKIPEDSAFIETSRQQLLDLIRQNINHCSIFCWGLFNEVHVRSFDPLQILLDQKKLAHGEDPTRPTIAATSHMHSPAMNKIPDLLGWNRYPGWYDSLSDLSDSQLWDRYKPTSCYGGFCFSEYGAGANIKHHEQNPTQPVPRDFWHPEEWQSIVHEAHWKCFSQKSYVWGKFVWNMFEFCAAKRREGGQVAINDKGLITFDRKIKKDAFYFYKANWSNEPVLYLTSKRHLIRNQAQTPVKVYSNQGRVTLLVNGRKVGSMKPDKLNRAIWDKVVLRRGTNKVVVTSGNLRDEIVWTYDPQAKSLKPDVRDKSRIHGDGGFGQ